MVVEILGARLLGPFFGVGLFVWSSILSVTLVALAVGYYVGGRFADVRPAASRVYWLLISAGCLVALIPICADFVLEASDALGIRAGSLVSAAVLLSPSLVALGMVTTTTVRLAATDLAVTGRLAGLVYAISTIGGLVGTILTGFVFVPNWAVNNTLAGTAAVLLLAGMGGLLVRKQRGVGRAGLALGLPLVALAPADPELAPQVKALERSESLLGRLTVVEDSSRAAPLRLLRADHSFIGGMWTETREPAFAFVHLLEAVRLARPQGRRLLQIGLGIGSLSMSMRSFGVQTDVVEIDPEVVRLAREYFGYQPSGAVYVEDARTVIRRLTTRYDFIVHDTFTGGAVPEHLLSLEVLQQLKSLLVPGGVLAVNVVGGAYDPLDRPVTALNKTVRAAFEEVRAFRETEPSSKSSLSNIVFFASDAPLSFRSTEKFEGSTCRAMLTSFRKRELPHAVDEAAPLITDAHNPMVRLALPVNEAFRQQMNELYPAEFWAR